MSYRLITVLFVRVTCRCFPVHSSNARCISRWRSGALGVCGGGGGTGAAASRARRARRPACPQRHVAARGARYTHSTMYCVPWYTWVLSRFPVRLSRRGLRPRGSYNSAHVHEYQVAARAAQAEGTTTLLRRHVREGALAAACAALSRSLLLAAAPTSLVATLTRRRGHP
jgi:hypothetical protein